jgi:hypothetical protein
MRTVLFSGVAALALTLATGSLAPANAQTQSPPAATPNTMGTAAPVANDAKSPAPAAPAEASAQPDQTTTSAPEQAAPAPVKHVRHVHHAVASNTGEGADAGGEHWAHQPGTGESGPASMRASNIDAADTHSDIAPHLPEPAVGQGADADTLLQAAQSALAAHKTGTAQQALEMAETRLLDRSTPPDQANQPDQGPRIEAVTKARKALASGDTKAADSAIQMALGGK